MNNEVILLILTTILVIVECSEVIDQQYQQALYAADYCKSIGVCPEGTHVLCTHYVPNKTHGPLCTETQEVFIAPDYAELILDLLNVIRGRSAQGKTYGMANLTLPRAYGLYRLEWDPELSTLAQVWANTCIIGSDMCRATKKFPNPAQLAGITRFNEDWLPINAKGLFNYTGLSIEKVKYGIHSLLRSWYRTKEYVHPDDITESSDVWPKHLGNNIFLMTVHGRVTHVGCGVSLFKEYSYDRTMKYKTSLTHNVVRVVCNLSSRILPTPGKNRVYNTEPPSEPGYTIKCGCPLGYDEDEYCLCYESGRKMPFSCKSKECKPAVVVLPIFTFENAPLSIPNGEFRKVNSNPKTIDEVDLKNLDDTNSRRHDLRGSIFIKSSVFELPSRKLKNERNENKLLEKNETRRDFSDERNLVTRNSHVRRIINITEPQRIDDIKNITTISLSKIVNKRNEFNNLMIENFPKTANRMEISDSVTRLNPNINSHFQKHNAKSSLITLLDELEKEANNVQLACERKKVLNHKIRKIYNVFIEKTYSPRDNNNTINDGIKNASLTGTPGNEHEQFNIINDKIFDKNHNNDPTLKNRYFKELNENSVKVNVVPNFKVESYDNNDEMLGIPNIHGIRSSPNNKRDKMNYFRNENSSLDDDLLNIEKRQFYQDRLNNLKRKFQDFQNYGNQNNMHAARYMRRMLPNYHELQVKRKMPQLNRF